MRNFHIQANKTQAATLESVMLRGAKHILGCSSKTCNEAINEREIRKFEEGLNTKVKLLLNKTFNKVVEFKKPLFKKYIILALEK